MSNRSTRTLSSNRSTFKSFYNDEEVHTFVVIPPDGGWGWVIVFCSFICHFIIDGTIYTYGLFIHDISCEFEVKIAQTVFVGSLLSGMSYIVGPFVSACLNRFDFRLVSFFGFLCAAIAYTLSYFAVNYYMFMLSYGVLLGIGYGMAYVPALVIISLYFAKWRALAVCIATTGTGVGCIVMPHIIKYLLDYFGWRSTFLSFFGFVGVGMLAALTFRPLNPVNVINKKQNESHVKGSSKARFSQDRRIRCSCCHWGNKYFPTAAEVIPEDFSLEDIYSDSPKLSATTIYRSETSGTTLDASLFLTSWYKSECCEDCFDDCSARCKHCCCCGYCQIPSRPMYRDDIFYNHSIHLIKETRVRKRKEIIRKRIALEKRKAEEEARRKKQAQKKLQDDRKKMEEQKKKTAKELEKLKEKEEQTKKEVEKPSSSIPESVKSQADRDEELRLLKLYHMSVTRVTMVRELKHTYACCICDISGMRTLTTMLDFRLLKSAAFLVLAMNGFFFTFGYMIPFLFIFDRAIEAGIEDEYACWFISAIGLSNTIGRIISGFLPCIVTINTSALIYSTTLSAGVITALSGLYLEKWTQVIYACGYGLLTAPFMALRSVLIVEIFGLENLTNIFGLQLLFSGIATMNGVTITGFLRDLTDDYTNSFYLSGGCICISAFLVIILKPIKNWEKRQAEEEL